MKKTGNEYMAHYSLFMYREKLQNTLVYRKNIINTLRQIGAKEKEITEVVEVIKRKYDWKYPLSDREPRLCFYSDISLLSEDMSAGYEQFCENIRGELARNALKEKYPDLYRYLRENGKAFLVKAKIPFSIRQESGHFIVAVKFSVPPYE